MLTARKAQENYDYFRHKCENAIQDRQSARSSIFECKSNKIDFEKRIQELEKIINMLENENDFFGVISSINMANKASNDANDSFHSCIKCDSSNPTDLHSIFKTKSVTEDRNSNSALIEFKNEKNRLEQELQNLDRNIRNLETEITNLTRSINNYSYEISFNKKQMIILG